MSYTPTEWSTGDTITASAMNKIENGIANAGGVMIITSELIDGVVTMNKTFQEIYDAFVSGVPVYYSYCYGELSDYTGSRFLAPIVCAYNYNYTETLRIGVNMPFHFNEFRPSVAIFSADGLNDYPTFYKYQYTTAVNS